MTLHSDVTLAAPSDKITCFSTRLEAVAIAKAEGGSVRCIQCVEDYRINPLNWHNNVFEMENVDIFNFASRYPMHSTIILPSVTSTPKENTMAGLFSSST